MKYPAIFVILFTVVFVLSTLSVAEAHPHATIDLLGSHSHDIHDSNFQEDFVVHKFNEVIFSVFDWIKSYFDNTI